MDNNVADKADEPLNEARFPNIYLLTKAIQSNNTQCQHLEVAAEARYKEVVAKLLALGPGIAAKREQVHEGTQEFEALQQQLGDLQRGFTGGLYRTAQDERTDELEVQIQDMANRLEAEQMEFEEMEAEYMALLRSLPDGPLPDLE